MAGTRRGSERKQQSDVFEAANPFLTRVDTRLDVDRVDEPPEQPHQGPPNIIAFGLDPQPDGVPFPRVTQDGAPGDVDVEEFFDLTPLLSTAFLVETPVGFLFSVNDPGNGPGGPFNSLVSMSDYGFGVTRPEQGDDEFALDDDEQLIFVLDDEFFFSGNGAFDDIDYPFGAAEVGVDFMVLGGSGQIELTLFDDVEDDGETFLSGTLSDGDTGSFSANLADALAAGAAIGVTGSLEVAVVGIDLTTNFAGSLVDVGVNE